MNWKTDTLLGRIESGDWSNLKTDFEKVIGKKIYDRVQEKKKGILNKLNGITEAYQESDLDDIMGKVSDGEGLTDDEVKILSAAIDSAKGNDKGTGVNGEVLDKIMSKVSNAEELTDVEKDALEAALEVSDAYNKKKK